MLTGDLIAIRMREVFCQIGFEKFIRLNLPVSWLKEKPP